MEKRTEKALGKQIYLLGKDKHNILYWLESPSWDNWYWGLGYVETYKNNKNPQLAKNISSHQHFDELFFNNNKSGYYNFINFFVKTTLSNEEIWKLLDIMKTAYVFKKMAEFMHAGYTSNPCYDILVDKTEEDKINKVLLPALFTEIDKLLKPEA